MRSHDRQDHRAGGPSVKRACLALSLLAMAHTLPYGSTESIEPKWAAVRIDLRMTDAILNVSALVLCPGSEHCALAWHAQSASGYSESSLLYSSPAGVRVEASVDGTGMRLWKPYADLAPFIYPSDPPGLALNGSIHLNRAADGEWFLAYLVTTAPVRNILLAVDPEWAVIEFATGFEAYDAFPRDFESASHAFVNGMGFGLVYEKTISVQQGILGVFFPVAFGFVSDASVEGPNSTEPCQSYTFYLSDINLGLNCIDSWPLHGPAGDWVFRVAARSQLAIPSDVLWIVWADARPV